MEPLIICSRAAAPPPLNNHPPPPLASPASSQPQQMPPPGSRANIWAYVAWPDGEKGKWQCSFCGKKLSGSAGRLAAHLAKDGSDPGIAACAAAVGADAKAAALHFVAEAARKRLQTQDLKRKRQRKETAATYEAAAPPALVAPFSSTAAGAAAAAAAAVPAEAAATAAKPPPLFVAAVSAGGGAGGYAPPLPRAAVGPLLAAALDRARTVAAVPLSVEQAAFGSAIICDALSPPPPPPLLPRGAHRDLCVFLVATPSHEAVLDVAERRDDSTAAAAAAALLLRRLDRLLAANPATDMIVVDGADCALLAQAERRWPRVAALPCAEREVSRALAALSSAAGAQHSWWAAAAARATAVAAAVRRDAAALAAMRARGAAAPPLLPRDACLAPDLAVLGRLHALRAPLVTLASNGAAQTGESPPALAAPIRAALLDPSFWAQIACFLEVTAPAATLLAHLAGDAPCLGDIIPALIAAHAALVVDAQSAPTAERRALATPIVSALDDSGGAMQHFAYIAAYLLQPRFASAIKADAPMLLLTAVAAALDAAWAALRHPAYAAAYLLHPRYAGDDLPLLGADPEYERDLLLMLSRALGGDEAEVRRAMVEYAGFRAGQGVLREGVFRGLARGGGAGEPPMAPHLWWQSVGTTWRTLRPIAMRLLSKTPSASHCGRVWSTVDRTLPHRRSCDLTGAGPAATMLRTGLELRCHALKAAGAAAGGGAAAPAASDRTAAAAAAAAYPVAHLLHRDVSFDDEDLIVAAEGSVAAEVAVGAGSVTAEDASAAAYGDAAAALPPNTHV
ncbi:hypothetical protein JKP88DRAFT_261549 [Tribonema minus]|uniref:BED-type domain-containing protein n=1 Tax=Tribonema minus TaxID=303371 RepID=A0A835YJW9_9STRA|nr:hypothetical protein JKP88DRAFT_261549 [Tribonema minus]